MTKKDEALKLALEALNVLLTEPIAHKAADKAEYLLLQAAPAIREALAEQPAQQQKEGFASPGGGYVPAIPRPMPLDWKLVPRKATPEMLKAMDECAQEGYDERLYAGMASSVYMAAWDASPVMGTLPEQPAQQQEPVAWMDGYRNIYSLEEKAAGCPEATIALVPMANHKKTSGSPINEIQCVCGAVWLGEEMVHLPDKRPPASKPWVSLTDEQIGMAFRKAFPVGGVVFTNGAIDFARAIEAAHGIKGDA